MEKEEEKEENHNDDDDDHKNHSEDAHRQVVTTRAIIIADTRMQDSRGHPKQPLNKNLARGQAACHTCRFLSCNPRIEKQSGARI